MRLVLFLYVFFHIFTANAQRTISGYVKSQEKGIENVIVSVGVNVTATNSKGYYELIANSEDKFVQISTPAGFLVERNGTIPLFYIPLSEKKKQYNFELYKNPKSDWKHNFIAQTDVQVADENDIAEYKKYLVSDIIKTIKKDNDIEWFGIDLGDLVGDDPMLLPKYSESMSEINIPFYRSIGNHDMAYWGRSHETSETNFNNNFGPTRYSFNKGNAHYIVINNNFFLGRDYFYVGYIDEVTYKWIEKDLSFVPEGSLVFLMMHIPSRLQIDQKPFEYTYSALAGATINVEPLYALLKKHKVHILSGHTHLNNNIEHRDDLMEHNIAAASGSWWNLPLCTDGTPRGYRVFEIEGENVKWYYKSEGKNKTYQSRSYVDSTGLLITNVWNYDSKWTLTWYEDGELIGSMEQFEGLDKFVADLCKDRTNTKYNWINPSLTKHLFRARLNNKNAKISVKIIDRFKNEYQEDLDKSR